jgi:uncharacterized membrane protein YeaQ/YmgE (transglycosylase-associated protein family)
LVDEGYRNAMTANGILSAILIGIVVGTLGRLILPGRQRIGVIATVAVGVGAALLGTWVAGALGIADRAPARLDWAWADWHLTWSWAELGVQIAVAVVGIALATVLTNTVLTDDRRPRRRTRSKA